MTDEIKKHADKIVADTLDSYLTGGQTKKPEPIAPYVRGGGRRSWASDDYDWETARPAPRYSVRPTMDEWLDEAEANGVRVHRRSSYAAKDDAGDMPLFLKREKLPVAKSVRVDEPDRETLKECKALVRETADYAEVSSFLLIKMADLVMREMENAMECGGLIWKSEMACFDAKLMVEKLIKEKVFFQSRHGELLPVVVK